ncbi:hypothetical protein [Luteimonas sp. A534]
MMALLGLAACAGLGTAEVPTETPFAGAWESCEGVASSEECSRYLLVQRADRICGTWSYLASGKVYEGRVVARATSSNEARRTQVCGRPGAETDTECGDGWQGIDKPLRLCDGNLGDLTAADGACLADYRAVPTQQGEWDALQAQPWVENCLSDGK